MEEVNINYLDKHKKFRIDNKKLATVFIVSAFVVAIIVFWWLKLIGITVTGDAFCGLDEHVHSEACYTSELICGFDEATAGVASGEDEDLIEEKALEESTTQQEKEKTELTEENDITSSENTSEASSDEEATTVQQDPQKEEEPESSCSRSI